MSQIEEQLNSNFEEILKKIRTNRNTNLTSDEDDAENNMPVPSSTENERLRKQHASKTEIDKDKRKDNHFQSSEMNELRQPSTPLKRDLRRNHHNQWK